MVAQFLRLKLRLLANIFRRSPWQVVGIVLGLVYGVGMAALLFASLVGLRFADDVELIRDVFIVIGAATVIGFVVFPLVFGVEDTMDPRRFALFGLPNRTLAIGLAAAAMIGIPSFVLAIVLTARSSRGRAAPARRSSRSWRRRSRSPPACSWPASPLQLASVLLATRRAREVSGVLGVLLIVLMSPVIVVLATLDWADFRHPGTRVHRRRARMDTRSAPRSPPPGMPQQGTGGRPS